MSNDKAARIMTGGAMALLSGVASQAQAGTFTAPSGVTGPYLIAFESLDGTTATSSAIGDYNTFANNEAALNTALPSTTWAAVVSTSATSAANNIACLPGCASDPVYNVDGTQVATSLTNFLNSTWTTFIEHQDGTAIYGSYVWTGSANGGGASTKPLGSSPHSSIGCDWYPNNGEIMNNNVSANSAASYPIYAISGEQNVATAVPEPLGLSLFALGTGLTAAARRLRRTSAKTAAAR